jgi:signal transduction histidine kinase
MDRNGLILYSSGGTRYSGESIFSQEVQSLIPSDIKDSFNQFIRDSLKGNTGHGDFTSQGKTSTIAYQPVTIHGKDFAILYIVTPHQFASDVVSFIEQPRILNLIIIIAIGTVATGIAIIILIWNKRLSELVALRTAELKESNDSLLNSNSQLAEANEQLKVHDNMQKEFINVAAHELRTPMQPLLGVIEMMTLSMEESGQDVIELSKEEIEMLSRNAKRLEKLTQTILDVTRIESKRLKLDKEKFDLNQKVINVINDIRTRNKTERKLSENNSDKIPPVPIVFHSECPQQHQQQHQSLIVEADKTRIFEVISNLLNNAMKFTKEGRIEVTTWKENNTNSAIVRIKDSGKGIDAEMIPRLFTKFATRSETGTGLGLYISKSIIEAHGGKMWAENNKDGPGASFYFSLPLSKNQNTGIEKEYAG